MMANQDSELELLEQIELSWNKAIEDNLVSEMGKYMSDDWVIFSGDGNTTTKETFLQLVTSGDLVHSKMDFEIMNAKIYENTGLIMQRGTSAGTWQGNSFSNYEIASTVFIRKNNKWVAVQTMIAPAKSEDKETVMKQNNTITHIDIPAPDLTKAISFYSQLFNWNIQVVTANSNAFFRIGDTNSGGGFDTSLKPSTEKTGHQICIDVENIEQTIREVKRLGGSIQLPKTEIGGGHGFYAVIQDPNGNSLQIHSNT